MNNGLVDGVMCDHLSMICPDLHIWLSVSDQNVIGNTTNADRSNMHIGIWQGLALFGPVLRDVRIMCLISLINCA